MSKRKPGTAGTIVLAVVVLLVAMTGSATAGALITGKQIKDGTVTGKDLRNSSVTGEDVKDFSLRIDDFTGSIQGPQGPPGPAGPAGPRGPAGFSGVSYNIAEMPIPTGQTRAWGVLCPAGTKATGGGVSTEQPYSVLVSESAPLNDGAGWTVGVRSRVNSPTVRGYAWVACAVAP